MTTELDVPSPYPINLLNLTIMATRKKATKSEAAPVEQTAAAALVIPAPIRFAFTKEPNSPFSDGYSIAGEEAYLADFMAGPMPESDPLYERYIELEDRKDRLERRQVEFEGRKGAESVVTRQEARAIDALGTLVDEDVDQMTIHTKEAYRMFMGRTREPGKEVAPIIGGRRVASALRGLWLLTGNDNPYADWALLRHEQTIEQIQKRLRNDTKAAETVLADLKRKGLTYSILQSAEPKVLNLGYRSPYGYAISTLIVEFDYFVRLQKTLARKTLRSDDQVRKAIADLTRLIRSVFNESTRFDRWLTREEVRTLSRSDFLPEAGADAGKRVEFASGVFGVVPSEVFTGKLHPRHSRRRTGELTAADRQLLQTVGSHLDERAQDAASGVQEESDAGLV